MTGYSGTYSTNLYSPSEGSYLLVPRRPDPTRRAIIFAHGAGGTALHVVDGRPSSGVAKIARLHGLAAHAGYVVLSGDWGGTQTFGSDASLTAIQAGWQWLKQSGLCATDKCLLSMLSMGGLTGHRLAQALPDEIAAMMGMAPALDIEDLRADDALGTREAINTAWGLPAGSYIGSGGDETPIPTRGRIFDNLATYAHIPTRLWYSSADTVTEGEDVVAYAAGRANVETTLLSTSLDHGDGIVDLIPDDDWLGYVARYAQA